MVSICSLITYATFNRSDRLQVLPVAPLIGAFWISCSCYALTPKAFSMFILILYSLFYTGWYENLIKLFSSCFVWVSRRISCKATSDKRLGAKEKYMSKGH